jgi:hypothetical protein
MQHLSSGLTVIYKRVVPVGLAAAVAWFVIAGVLEGRAKTLGFFMVPAIILVIGYAIWFFLYSELADEVMDCGSYLLVRVGTLKDRVPLDNIKDVNTSWNENPPVMTLHFVIPGKHGESISFIPFAGFPFSGTSTRKLKVNLLDRADAARRVDTKAGA